MFNESLDFNSLKTSEFEPRGCISEVFCDDCLVFITDSLCCCGGKLCPVCGKLARDNKHPKLDGTYPTYNYASDDYQVGYRYYKDNKLIKISDKNIDDMWEPTLE